jgi:hypothetical protein
MADLPTTDRPSDLQDALTEYDRKGAGLNVLPASSPAMTAIVEAARRVANLSLKRAAAHVDAELGDRKGMRQDIDDDIWNELCITVAKVAVSAALGITEDK